MRKGSKFLKNNRIRTKGYNRFLTLLIVTVLALSTLLIAVQVNAEGPPTPPNTLTYLVCESEGVTEFDSDGAIVWQITGLYNPYDAERLDSGNTLITEFNPGTVTEFDSDGAIVWQIADLIWPIDAERLDSGNTLITEYDGRVTEFDSDGAIVWQITGLYSPYDAERLDSGNTLITEIGGRVTEFDSDGAIVWQKNFGMNYWTVDVEGLDSGNILITDELAGCVTEFDSSWTIVWQITGLSLPWDAERLDSGNTLITELYGRVTEFDSDGAIVWQKGGLEKSWDAECLVGGDTTPPEITVSLNKDVLWPPNHKYHEIIATVAVTDDIDPSPTFTLVSVTSNEPDECKGTGDGNTCEDFVIVDDLTFNLRAERAEDGTGRIYTITYEATDASGNTARASATVTVPVER